MIGIVMRAHWLVLACLVFSSACRKTECPTVAATPAAAPSKYLDYTGRDDVLSGGVRMIPIKTPAGTFKVWTKRVGNNPRIKVLLLHGGPAMTHEYFEIVDSYFPKEEIEYYFYDQLEAGNSDRPNKRELWSIEHYVDEVEQVRQALKLDNTNFYLVGHSWGGLLATEYALAHPDALKGVVISNMMASVPVYNKYAHEVLMPQMDQKALAEILAIEKAKQYESPRYFELLMPSYYTQHVLRMPAEQWPEPVMRSFGHLNKPVYIAMQGPSEMGASGILENWDRFADLPKLTMPTLVIGAKHDTMDPAYMEKMAAQIKRGRFLLCPDGSHMAMYDDAKTYFPGLIKFIKDVDAGRL
jgi:proline iminopeptidase